MHSPAAGDLRADLEHLYTLGLHVRRPSWTLPAAPQGGGGITPSSSSPGDHAHAEEAGPEGGDHTHAEGGAPEDNDGSLSLSVAARKGAAAAASLQVAGVAFGKAAAAAGGGGGMESGSSGRSGGEEGGCQIVAAEPEAGVGLGDQPAPDAEEVPAGEVLSEEASLAMLPFGGEAPLVVSPRIGAASQAVSKSASRAASRAASTPAEGHPSLCADEALLRQIRSALGARWEGPAPEGVCGYGDDMGAAGGLEGFFRQPASISIDATAPASAAAAAATRGASPGAAGGGGAVRGGFDQDEPAWKLPASVPEEGASSSSPLRTPTKSGGGAAAGASAAASSPLSVGDHVLLCTPHSSGVKGRAVRVPVISPPREGEDDAVTPPDADRSPGGGGSGGVKGAGGGSRGWLSGRSGWIGLGSKH